MKFKLIYVFLLLLAVPMSAQKSLDALLRINNNESVPYINVEELRNQQTNDTVIILDAREREEFDISHIEGSKFVGYKKFDSEVVTNDLTDKSTPIIVYCSLGIRSEDIGEKLQKAGYTNVKNLYGGIFEWKNNGYPVINSEGNETENVHTYSRFWSRWLKTGTKVYD